MNSNNIYEEVIDKMIAPPIQFTDRTTYETYKKYINKDKIGKLVKFMEESDLKTKIPKLGDDFVSMIDNLNELKRSFEEIKMVPEKPIPIDPTAVTVRKVELNDKILNIFHEAFISSSYCCLLDKEERRANISPLGRAK